MLNIISQCKRLGLFTAAIFLAIAPTAALADSTQSCTPPTSQTGVNRPVGADSGTFTYDCASGLWLNAHFSYNPATGQYTALDPVVYTYNASTGLYDTTSWVYNAPSNTYVPVTSSVSTPAAGATVIGAPPAPTPNNVTNTGPDSNNSSNTDGTGNISNTGPGSSNSLNGTTNNNTTENNGNTLGVTNSITQTANSGNALVVGNTTGGDATTGNVQDIANIVNMLQSSSNALGGNTMTFVANLNGDVNGDLLIDPSQLGTIQPASNATGNNNLTVNNQTDAAINNTINLAANSGNAGVSNNTTGGNATSGSAEAIANVVNLIDSAISSGNSFIGVININGNFNGNILVPPDLINQLVASNVPTVNLNTGTSSNNLNVNNTNNLGINNNITASATSGVATVDHNTAAGSATSGSTANNITAFNLTGSNVIGANDLLVFVNVLGQWVGMIINAPSGATAAEFGGGITQDSQNNATVNNTANEQINNNITASARSGDASVTSNTHGGNAKTGNAGTAVNLLNVENSSLSFSGWFGILFINVFGSWHGNFGYSPAAVASNDSGNSSAGGTPSTFAVFRFSPHTTKTSGAGAGVGSSSDSFTTASNSSQGLGNSTLASSRQRLPSSVHKPTVTPAHSNLLVPILGSVIFALYIVGDRAYSVRQSRHV